MEFDFKFPDFYLQSIKTLLASSRVIFNFILKLMSLLNSDQLWKIHFFLTNSYKILIIISPVAEMVI